MSADFCVMLDCPPKQALGVDGLLRLIDDRRRAREAIGHYTRMGETPEQAARHVFEIQRTRGDRTVAVETCAEKLLAEAAVLDGHADKCADCPANLGQEPFGCYGRLEYPVPAEAEEFLMRLPADPNTHYTGNLLAQNIYDNGFNGAPIEEMRTKGGRFFRLGEAVEVSWGSGNSERSFNSDQILHLLLFGGPFPPTDALLLLMQLNLIRLDRERVTTPDDVRAAAGLLGDPEAPARLDFDLPLAAGRPPAEAASLLNFLTALFAGALLGAPVSVSA
jgi:hypothetical protein